MHIPSCHLPILLLHVLVFLIPSATTTVTAHTALVLGPTGAVGSEVLRALLRNENRFWKHVIAVTRKPFVVGDDAKVKVTQVRMQDLSSIDTDERFQGEQVDACFNAIGLAHPYNVNLHYWYATEVELNVKIAALCGTTLQSKHIALLSSVDAELNPQPMDQALLQDSQAPPVGWWGMLMQHYFQLKGLAEQAIASNPQLKHVRIFQPSNIVTENIRYGWLDWAVFKVSPFFDMILPYKYHSVPVDVLGTAMVMDAEQVLTEEDQDGGKTTKQTITRLHYDDYIRLLPAPGLDSTKDKEL